MAEFILRYSDFSYYYHDEDNLLGLPPMPVSERTLRRWQASGLVSGWCSMVSGMVCFTSGIVEYCEQIHKQLAVREPPAQPVISSGYTSVAQFAQERGITRGKAYSMVRQHGEELGVIKFKGLYHIPRGIPLDIIRNILTSY